MGTFGGLSRFRKKPDGGGAANGGGSVDSASASAPAPRAGDETASGGDTAANLSAAVGDVAVAPENSDLAGCNTVELNGLDVGACGAYAAFEDGRPSTSGSHGFSNIDNMMFSMENLGGGNDGAVMCGGLEGCDAATMAVLAGGSELGNEGSDSPIFPSFESRPSTSEGFQFGRDECVEHDGSVNDGSLMNQDPYSKNVSNSSISTTEKKPSGGGGGIGFLKKRAATLTSQDSMKSTRPPTPPANNNCDFPATNNSKLAEIHVKATEADRVNNQESPSLMQMSQMSVALTGDNKNEMDVSIANVLGGDIAEEKSQVPHSICAKADAVEDDLTVGTINTEVVLQSVDEMGLDRSRHQPAKSTSTKDESGENRYDDGKNQTADATLLRPRGGRSDIAPINFSHNPPFLDHPPTIPNLNQNESDCHSTMRPLGNSPVAIDTSNQTTENATSLQFKSPDPPSITNKNNGDCCTEQIRSPLPPSEMIQKHECSNIRQQQPAAPLRNIQQVNACNLDARKTSPTSTASIRGLSNLHPNDESIIKHGSIAKFLDPNTDAGISDQNGPGLIGNGTAKKSPSVDTNSPMQDLVADSDATPSQSSNNSRVLPLPFQENVNTPKVAPNGKSSYFSASARVGVAKPRACATTTSPTQTQMTNSHKHSNLPGATSQNFQSRFAVPAPRLSRDGPVNDEFMRSESAMEDSDLVHFDDSTKIVMPKPIATTPGNRPLQNMITPADRAYNQLQQRMLHEKMIDQNNMVSPTPQKPKNLSASYVHYDSSPYDRIVPGITPAPTQKNDRSEDKRTNFEGSGKTSQPAFSLSPARASESATPKTSNVLEQNAKKKWGSSSFSSANDTFDELLVQFQKNVQEGTDLYSKSENDLIALEVDLSHALAAALRYKGDMIDLLDDIEDVHAMAEGLLAEIIE